MMRLTPFTAMVSPKRLTTFSRRISPDCCILEALLSRVGGITPRVDQRHTQRLEVGSIARSDRHVVQPCDSGNLRVRHARRPSEAPCGRQDITERASGFRIIREDAARELLRDQL